MKKKSFFACIIFLLTAAAPLKGMAAMNSLWNRLLSKFIPSAQANAPTRAREPLQTLAAEFTWPKPHKSESAVVEPQAPLSAAAAPATVALPTANHANEKTAMENELCQINLEQQMAAKILSDLRIANLAALATEADKKGLVDWKPAVGEQWPHDPTIPGRWLPKAAFDATQLRAREKLLIAKVLHKRKVKQDLKALRKAPKQFNKQRIANEAAENTENEYYLAKRENENAAPVEAVVKYFSNKSAREISMRPNKKRKTSHRIIQVPAAAAVAPNPIVNP